MTLLHDKVAIVTGATSGIGRASAISLARIGVRLMLVGLNNERADDCRAEIIEVGGQSRTTLGDVSHRDFCDYVVERTLDAFGQLDILINAAGVIYRNDALCTQAEDWYRVMGTNVDGVFFMSRAAVAAMLDHGGSVINLGSTAGLVGCPELAAYCASKGAVIQLTRAMALDHAANNIRINAVCPGAVDTPMLTAGYSDHSTTATLQVYNRRVAMIPQHRIPSATEIADLIVFLASDNSRHITGAVIPIDGGYTAQ